MRAIRLSLVATLLLLVATPMLHAQKLVDVVNDTTDPNHREDGEPSIAVNPLDANEISIIFFGDPWSPSASQPIFKSRDGGLTWKPVLQIPSPQMNSDSSYDQTIRYTADGKLVVASVAAPAALETFIFRQTGNADDPLTPGMNFGYDQPQIASDNGSGSAFLNRRYVAYRDPSAVSTVGRTIDDGQNVTVTAAADGSSFSLRTTRIAVAPNGSIYIVYKTEEGSVDTNFETAHFRVNRSDDGGATWNALGSNAGVSVHGASAVTTWLADNFGNPAKGKTGRARSSDAWIAVNPSNGDVWVAYCNKDASTFGQIFVVKSTTNGASWSAQHRVTDGTRHSAYPEIAVTSSGDVGVLYIDYDDSGATNVYRHRFAKSPDGVAWSNSTLQTVDPSSIGNAVTTSLWGDYEGLTAAGHTFYGVFTGQSIGRATPEMDPIFFRVTATPADQDFYVRDWTDSAASGDNGAEQSTHANFHATSDIWNLPPNVVPTFNAQNQPVHQLPNNGTGPAGDNLMFSRIFRNTSGGAQTIKAHYMYSEFGVGSNYQDAGSPAIDSIPFPSGATMVVSPGHAWHLPTTTSIHLCMLVEIDTPLDPLQPPSLLNRAPGWPTSDHNVLNDNNKAQRNTDVAHEFGGPHAIAPIYYAIVHNPLTARHTFTLAYTVGRGVATIEAVNGEERARGEKGTLRVTLAPGENRWLGFAIQHDASAPAFVDVTQLEKGEPVNGFTIRVEPAADGVLIDENLANRRAFFNRLAAMTHDRAVAAYADKLVRATSSDYRAAVAEGSRVLGRLDPETTKLLQSSPFRLFESLKQLDGAIGGPDADALSADAAFLRRGDAALTMILKRHGDRADIAQMFSWQNELLHGKCSTSASYADKVRELAKCANVAVTIPANADLDQLEGIHRSILLKLAGE